MKKHFPIFANNPGLIYLDNAASTQKPSMVIDQVSSFVAKDYANIHRGMYGLSEASELKYHQSKELVAELINAKAKEIIYSYNATYAINLLAQSLVASWVLGRGDAVLIGIWDHHANILPWMKLGELFGFEVRFFWLNENYELDWDDFAKHYTDEVKVVVCSQVSNVTGGIYDVAGIKKKLKPETFFLVDGSQSVPNMVVDFAEIGADALVFTGHKMMADTGIGVLALKSEWIKRLDPMILGGGTIKDVDTTGFSLLNNSEKFEAWTPNIIGAVSLGAALSFIQSLGSDGSLRSGMEVIQEHERKLVAYSLEQFQLFGEQLRLIGPWGKERVAVFSFILPDHPNFNQLGELFAAEKICIRCGGHCAYPLHKAFKAGGSCRMSAYLYNDIADLEHFFAALWKMV